MSEQSVKVGQVYKSNDGGSLFKVSEVLPNGVEGACPDGAKPRRILMRRLLSKGRNGYRLIQDVP